MKYFDHFFQPQGWQEKTFTAKDGADLRYGIAQPKGNQKGVVVITTGYGDSIEHYFDTVQDYLDRSYAVVIMDWAGQGGSIKRGGSPAANRAFGIADHVAHLHELRQTVVAPIAGDQPVILSTHSLGGQVALNHLQQHPQDFDATIMAAPLIDFGLSPQMRAAIRTIFKYAVMAGLRDMSFAGGRASIQKQAINARKKIKKDEPVRIDLHRTFFMLAKPIGAEDPSVGLIESLFESTARMNDETALRNINTPLLIGLAGRDHIVNNDSIRRAAQLLPQARLVDMPDATHGIWSEPPHITKSWWAEVDAFLDTLQNNSKARPVPKKPAPPAQA